MSNIAVNVAVIHEGKVLLTKREDFETWILPSGGEIKCQAGETIAVEWFGFKEMPSPLSLGHKRRIKDAIEGIVLQEYKLPAMPEKLTRKELFELFAKSGLSRQEFYMHTIEGAEASEVVEVGGL